MKTIIVAGITRSGLTLMMQILHKDGIPCYGTYPAFEDHGGDVYYDLAFGKAIKLVDTHRCFPPVGNYNVIVMKRNINEQANSISKFLKMVCGIPVSRSESRRIKKSLIKDYNTIDNWSKRQDRFIDINFEELILNPKRVIRKINFEFNLTVSEDSSSCVHHRSTNCYDGLLELEILKQHQTKACAS